MIKLESKNNEIGGVQGVKFGGGACKEGLEISMPSRVTWRHRSDWDCGGRRCRTVKAGGWPILTSTIDDKVVR